jgi:hypothetical protein
VRELFWVFLGFLSIGTGIAIFMIIRKKGALPLDSRAPDLPHSGINYSRVSFAGLPGIVVILVFGLIFWRVTLPMIVAGGLIGAILVLVGRLRSAKSSTPLGLSEDRSNNDGRRLR